MGEWEVLLSVTAIVIINDIFQEAIVGFLGSAVVKNLPANSGDVGLSLGLGRFHMPRSN